MAEESDGHHFEQKPCENIMNRGRTSDGERPTNVLDVLAVAAKLKLEKSVQIADSNSNFVFPRFFRQDKRDVEMGHADSYRRNQRSEIWKDRFWLCVTWSSHTLR